jgi:large subunit ribosomal protein L29
MEVEKIRNTTDAELLHQQRELSDQLFRLRFQLKMGQTESLKKLRGLRKDIARIKTVIRERQLGFAPAAGKAAAQAAVAAEPKAERKASASSSARSAKKKTAAPKKKTAAKGKK